MSESDWPIFALYTYIPVYAHDLLAIPPSFQMKWAQVQDQSLNYNEVTRSPLIPICLPIDIPISRKCRCIGVKFGERINILRLRYNNPATANGLRKNLNQMQNFKKDIFLENELWEGSTYVIIDWIRSGANWMDQEETRHSLTWQYVLQDKNIGAR